MRVQRASSRSRLINNGQDFDAVLVPSPRNQRGLFDGLIFPSKNQLRFEPKVLKFLRLYSALNNSI